MGSVDDILGSGLNPEETPPEQLRRFRYVNIALLVMAAVGAPYSPVYWWLGLRYSSAAVAVAVALAVLTVVRLRRHRDVALAAREGTLLVYFAVVIAGVETGGLDALSTAWFLVLPILAALLQGIRGGLIWACVIALSLVCLALAHRAGLVPQRLSDPLYYGQAMMGVFGALVALVAITSVFLHEASEARGKLEASLAALREENASRAAAEREARAALAVRGRFVALMSHEIRTPLNGVLGMNQLLQETPMSDEQRQLVGVAIGATRSLQGILDDILDFSKLDAGKITLEEIPFELQRIVHEAAALFLGGAGEKGVALECHLDPSAPAWVTGDPTRLRQVLRNLLSNAVKFTNSGLVRLEIQRGADGLRFRVSDSGIGISPEVTRRLFEPFTQAEESTTRRFGGTGLGLSISRELVELMGGTLTVESQVGEGSCFSFALRLSEVAPPQAPSAVMEAARVVGLRILVAEDNPVNQLLARRLLTKNQHEVVIVENGLLAVEAARGQEFDLVLMDIRMPVMNGLEATRAIRALPGAAGRLPIIALTANAMSEDRDACFEAGMNDFIPKPFDFEVFRSKLAAWGVGGLLLKPPTGRAA